MTYKRPLAYPLFAEINIKVFLFLLSKSLSLSVGEKVRILDEMPSLSQYQVDALAHTFLDERHRFINQILPFNPEEETIVKGLMEKCYLEWLEIKREFQLPRLPTENTWVKLFFEDVELRERLTSVMIDDVPVSERVLDAPSYIDMDLAQIKQRYQYPTSLFKDAQNKALITEKNEKPMLHPSEVVEQLQSTVIGQSHALKKLATSLFFHKKFEHASRLYSTNKEKNARQMPILVVGSTGLGKTHLIKSITKQYDLNLVMIDASTMVRTGIVGTSLDTIGRMIYDQANQNLEVAEYSVVFLDEFDKLFISQREEFGSTIGVQLLTVLEGSAPIPVEMRNEERSSLPHRINSQNMLFILAGSFGVHEKLFGNKTFGFHNKTNHNNPHKYQQIQLSEMGLPDELAGRIGQVICLNELSDDDYRNILYHSPTSPFQVLRNQLDLIGCTVDLSPDLVDKLIADNKKEIAKFGARGLYQAFNALPQITDILMAASESNDATHFVIE